MSEVNLIGITKPSAYTGCWTANDLVAYAARVSNPANQNNNETAPNLLKYLVTHKHWSPFEMVHIVMEIKTTRDISRQILRHRSFSFQEFSQRYAVADDFIHDREARKQDSKNRQNSLENDDPQLQEAFNMKQASVVEKAKEVYTWALEQGIAKEQARAVLPEGLTGTTLYMAGNLRSWIHYCELRMKNGTQKEHMDIAEKCWNIIASHFPSVDEAMWKERHDRENRA
jgi:thymidylate synthase (FAD)